MSLLLQIVTAPQEVGETTGETTPKLFLGIRKGSGSFIKTWNAVSWKDLEAHPVPNPCHGQGHPPLEQVAQRTVPCYPTTDSLAGAPG